jgi:hypothetical protein
VLSESSSRLHGMQDIFVWPLTRPELLFGLGMST